MGITSPCPPPSTLPLHTRQSPGVHDPWYLSVSRMFPYTLPLIVVLLTLQPWILEPLPSKEAKLTLYIVPNHLRRQAGNTPFYRLGR